MLTSLLAVFKPPFSAIPSEFYQAALLPHASYRWGEGRRLFLWRGWNYIQVIILLQLHVCQQLIANITLFQPAALLTITGLLAFATSIVRS